MKKISNIQGILQIYVLVQKRIVQLSNTNICVIFVEFIKYMYNLSYLCWKLQIRVNLTLNSNSLLLLKNLLTTTFAFWSA